jgi:transcriptional regulator with XRE-family HTH domain
MSRQIARRARYGRPVREPGRPAGPSRLAQRRRAEHLSQRALAELVGVSERAIQRIEAGEVAHAKIPVLANCALVLGCEIEELLEPAWRKWSGVRKKPATAEVERAREGSFKPSSGTGKPYRS